VSYRHLFVAVELDNPNAVVIERAAAFARFSGAQLSVATAIPDMKAFYHGTERRIQQSFDDTLVESAQEGLNALCRKAHVRPDDVYVLRGDPDREVVEEAHARGADLIVFGNHDRHGLDHYVGGFGLGLLHRAHCDLLAINLAVQAEDFNAPLIALANDADDARVMGRVVSQLKQSPRVAVHVVRPPWREPWAWINDVEKARVQIAAQIRTRMHDALSEFSPFELQVEFETPSVGIEAAATAGGHDLIVMGSGKHSQLGWHLGSTAHNLLSRTRHDVLLVRPQHQAD
jgi:nucleotide-binding universal stress UspA family protein